MKTFYACTLASKYVEENNFKDGCVGNGFTSLHENCLITAGTVQVLVEKIGRRYGLLMDDLFLPNEDEEGVSAIGYNRLENGDGDTPTPIERTEWENGKRKLFLADYTFLVEKRAAEPIPLEEFKTAGVQFHR